MLSDVLRTALALGLLGAPIFAQQGSRKDFAISGWGGYPISDELTSMWLAEPSGRPLLMVYFEGPAGWHKTEWKMNSKFEREKPGWAEFSSEKAKLRLWLDLDSGQAEVQGEKVNIRDSNTYLVLNVTDVKRQKVVPLGVLDLPRSRDDPSSVILLREHPELIDKAKKAVSNAAGA